MITLHVDLESQDNGKQNLRSLTFKKKKKSAKHIISLSHAISSPDSGRGQ